MNELYAIQKPASLQGENVKYKALLPIPINSKEKRPEIFAEASLRIN